MLKLSFKSSFEPFFHPHPSWSSKCCYLQKEKLYLKQMSNIDNLHLLHMILQNFGFSYNISQVTQNQSPTSFTTSNDRKKLFHTLILPTLKVYVLPNFFFKVQLSCYLNCLCCYLLLFFLQIFLQNLINMKNIQYIDQCIFFGLKNVGEMGIVSYGHGGQINDQCMSKLVAPS